MSEPPPPPVAGDAAGGRAEALTPERVEEVVAEFRSWLADAARDDDPRPEALPTEAPDLFTLLGQLTALRHEVNLQTRAVRTQQEQNAETLSQLTRSLESLRQSQAAAAQGRQPGGEDHLRPMATTLVDLHEALSLAAREVQRVQDSVLPTLPDSSAEEAGPPPSPPPPPAAPGWLRLLGFRGASPAAEEYRKNWEAWSERDALRRKQLEGRAAAAVERAGRLTASLATGYTMSLQRLERALRQHGLEPIAAVGEPFDPERMEVVEAVGGTGEPAGRVLDEVRRGYLWNGRVFRFAQVRVAKG